MSETWKGLRPRGWSERWPRLVKAPKLRRGFQKRRGQPMEPTELSRLANGVPGAAEKVQEALLKQWRRGSRGEASFERRLEERVFDIEWV